jgi:MFS family permease
MVPNNLENTEETPERAVAPVETEVEHELGQNVPPRHDPYAVLRLPDFRRYLIGGTFAAAGSQMTNVAAGWELYDRTHQPFSLGLLGLMAALPVIFLALPAGTLADRVDRKRIVLVADAFSVLCLLMLAAVSWTQAPLWMFYGLVLLNAICGAFLGPANQALLIGLIPTGRVADGLKWGSIRWQLAATLGPVLGGFLIARWGHPAPIYALDSLGRLLFCACIFPVRPRPQEISKEAMNWQSVAAGWHFVKSQPLILSTITLDMVAVLFGGATALMPVYAKSILNVGPEGLGPLRAAPAVGAIVMAIFLTQWPPMRRAGVTLLWAVSVFGAATIVFGLASQITGLFALEPEAKRHIAYMLSLAALFTLGAADNVSVVVRHTLLQVLTPDSMRGRVSAVNSVFIGTSNEIGELESGTAAQFLGPVIAVAGGGVLTIVTVLVVAAIWPAVRQLRTLEKAAEEFGPSNVPQNIEPIAAP